MMDRSHPRIRWTPVKSILVGLLAMVVSVIALLVILSVMVLRTKQEIPIGPVYWLIPIAAFAGGYYWSGRRSSRPKVPAKPPSNLTVIVKSMAIRNHGDDPFGYWLLDLAPTADTP
jgi:hypothetical protein